MVEPMMEFGQDIDLKVVTPLFLGNALQNAAELRPPSVKGVMRFWHRATGPESLKNEAALFGSSTGPDSGQAPFLLHLREIEVGNQALDRVGASFGYLGYGAILRGKSRQFISPGTELRLRLMFRPNAPPDTREGVLRSLRLMNYFGGLGARSRRGWGSVVLAKDLPADFHDLVSRIQRELDALSISDLKEANYTSFSRESRVVLLQAGTSWEQALNLIGQLMMEVRNPKTSPTEYPWAKEDTRVVSKYLRTGVASEAPIRAGFGLPHNYFFGVTKDKVEIEGGKEGYSRRASPLFIHVHPMQDGQYAVVVTFLPAPLLPDGHSLVMKTKGWHTVEVPPPTTLAAVEGFLDYISSKPGAKEVLI